jgi:hypothetical protein
MVARFFFAQWGTMYQMPINVPNGHNIYQTAVEKMRIGFFQKKLWDLEKSYFYEKLPCMINLYKEKN